MEFAFNCPINTSSLGAVSVSLLREWHQMGLNPCIFPIGGIDLSNQPLTPEFAKWIERNINRALTQHKRKYPCIKNFHINSGLESFSEKTILFTYHETDTLTSTEVNILKNCASVVVPSLFNKSVFEDHGVNNVVQLPLGFDKYSFNRRDKKYFNDGRIVFNLLGKLEKRKRHDQVIRAWIKKFGGNKKYSLQCAIYNNFFVQRGPNGQPIQDDNPRLIGEILEGKPKPFNVEFSGWFGQNTLYNEFLNSAHIAIGMSGGESWDLPVFQSAAMGKQVILLNAHAYKTWGNDANPIWVNPSGKAECYDGFFFQKGQIFNQGQLFCHESDDFIAACEEAIKRVEQNPINEAGLKIPEKYTWRETAENLLKLL